MSRPQVLKLTPKQREVLYRRATGQSYQDIADAMGISPKTVSRHLEDARLLLGARTTYHALWLARHVLEEEFE